jgi:hypothetical protein
MRLKMNPLDRRGAAPSAIVACVLAFVALVVPAMLLYPGGTWWDATTHGHRFWQNFLCDLEWRVALDGQPNIVGSRLAEAALLSLVLAFVPFWLVVPRLFADDPRLGLAVRGLGNASVAGMVAVALMPSERFGVLHGAAVVIAGVPGLSAATLSVVGLARGGRSARPAAWIGASMLVFAFTDFALYVSHLVAHVEGTPFIAAAQKVALILLLVWMVGVATSARSMEPTRGADPGKPFAPPTS